VPMNLKRKGHVYAAREREMTLEESMFVSMHYHTNHILLL